jgi:hypothetical protein
MTLDKRRLIFHNWIELMLGVEPRNAATERG